MVEKLFSLFFGFKKREKERKKKERRKERKKEKMRGIIQRVLSGSVTLQPQGDVVAKIDRGLVVLVGLSTFYFLSLFSLSLFSLFLFLFLLFSLFSIYIFSFFFMKTKHSPISPREDKEEDAQWLAKKLTNIRLWPEDGKQWMHSINNLNYQILLVSNFTLMGYMKVLFSFTFFFFLLFVGFVKEGIFVSKFLLVSNFALMGKMKVYFFFVCEKKKNNGCIWSTI